MEFFRPATWADALAIKAEQPAALAIAGGTDVMVDINFDRVRPAALLDLTGVSELAEWSADGPVIRLGAGVPYTRVIAELGDRLPGLAMASRTVGSPQIRNRGTVGGNLGSASPAGDPHPPPLADATVAAAAYVRGTREPPLGLPGRRRPSAAAGRRHRRGSSLGPGHQGHPDQGVLHRGEALGAGPGRADRRGARPGGRRPAAVLEGRRAQRDGHRGEFV